MKRTKNYSLYKGIQVTKAESAQLKKLNAKITKLNNTSIYKYFGKKGMKHAEKIGRDTRKAYFKLSQIEHKIYRRRMKK